MLCAGVQAGIGALRGLHRNKRDEKQNFDDLVRGLSKALDGGEWRVTLIAFTGGMCGSVEENVFNTNMIDTFFIHSTLELK